MLGDDRAVAPLLAFITRWIINAIILKITDSLTDKLTVDSFGWALGVHRAPTGYQHPWLVVTTDGTVGAWSREAARAAWRVARDGAEIEWVERIADQGYQ